MESIKLLFQCYQCAGADLQRERLMKTNAERKLRERQLATLEGTLVEARVAQRAVTRAVMAHHAIVKHQMDREFGRLVLERLPDLDELTRQKVADAVCSVARSVVSAIEEDCARA